MRSEWPGIAKATVSASALLISGACALLVAPRCLAADADLDKSTAAAAGMPVPRGETAEENNQTSDVWTPDGTGTLLLGFDGGKEQNIAAPQAVRLDKKAFAAAVKALEQRVFGHSNTTVDATVTLARMESFLIGEPQSGPLQERLTLVEAILNGHQGVEPAMVEKADERPDTTAFKGDSRPVGLERSKREGRKTHPP